MRDRNVQYPTRYRMTKVAGTDDIYEMEPVPGEVTDEGTLINKAALLKDTTAALFGFTAEQIPDAVPDDVLAMLKSLVDNAQSTADKKGRIELGSYIGTGTSGESNPCSLAFEKKPDVLWLVGYLSRSASSENRSWSLVSSNADFTSVIPIFPLSMFGDSYVKDGFYYYAYSSTEVATYSRYKNNTFQWYSNTADHQYNHLDYEYYYLAFWSK